MKIALIHYRIVNKGGLETRLLNYIDFFLSEGHEVSVLCSKIHPDIITNHKNLKIIKLNLGIMPKLFRKWYFNLVLKKEMKKHAFDFSLSLGRTSHQDAVLAPSNHLGYLKALNKKQSSISDYLQIYLDRVSYQKSKIIFAASEMMKSELENLYHINPQKIVVLYPPLNIHKFNKGLKEKQLYFKEKYNLNTNELCFLFVSTSNKRKGIELLKQVFSSLDITKYHLYISGDNPGIYNQKNIHYLGYQKNIEELYAAADFTIHPAIYEPFGQIISESLQCGTPVIISENTGAKELVANEFGIIINGFEKEDWLKAITNIKKREFSILSDFAILNQLSVESHVKMMLKYYQNL